MVVEHSASQVRQDRYDLYSEVTGQSEQALLRVTRVVNSLGGSKEEQVKRTLSNVTRLASEQRSRPTSWILLKVTRSVVDQLTIRDRVMRESKLHTIFNELEVVVTIKLGIGLNGDVRWMWNKLRGKHSIGLIPSGVEFDGDKRLAAGSKPNVGDVDMGYAEEPTKRVRVKKTGSVVKHSATRENYDYEVEVEEESTPRVVDTDNDLGDEEHHRRSSWERKHTVLNGVR
jgi:hypothetical protein